MPSVLAIHPTYPVADVSSRTVETLIATGAARITSLGRRMRLMSPTAVPVDLALATVQNDRRAVAVVPASAVGPNVTVLTVDGVDPLVDPSSYPFKVEGNAPPPATTMTAVGDLMLGSRVDARMRARDDFNEPLRRVRERLASADITVGTLESTLSRNGSPMQPSGENFAADPRVLPMLRRAGFDLLSLGNNHSGDYGGRALVETVEQVRRSGIEPVGAGKDISEARAPVIIERNRIRFGFIAFNGRGETAAAGRSRPGAVYVRMRPYSPRLYEDDLDPVVADVRRLRRRVDVVVVLPHWGQQYTHEQNADQRTIARRLIRAGADLILGSHPHWVQGVEIYRGKLIVYSMGNFVFSQSIQLPGTRETIAVELTFWGEDLKRAVMVPGKIDGTTYQPRFLSWRAGRSILSDVWRASPPPYGN